MRRRCTIGLRFVSIPIIVERGWKEDKLAEIATIEQFQSPSSWSVAGSCKTLDEYDFVWSVSIPIIVERGWKS